MSKIEKLRKRILSLPRDLTWNELITFMSNLDYELIDGGKGSHFAFYCEANDHYIRGIPKPHPKNQVKVFYIKSITKDLIAVGALSNE